MPRPTKGRFVCVPKKFNVVFFVIFNFLCFQIVSCFLGIYGMSIKITRINENNIFKCVFVENFICLQIEQYLPLIEVGIGNSFAVYLKIYGCWHWHFYFRNFERTDQIELFSFGETQIFAVIFLFSKFMKKLSIQICHY